MATSATRKSCGSDSGCKYTAVTNCEGCSKAFCIKHMIDHRDALMDKMKEVIREHDQLKKRVKQQLAKPDLHPFIEEINKWEKESIAKIQQRAKKIRQELLKPTTDRTNELSNKLQKLSETLKQGGENANFIETDLERWKKTLFDLNADFISPSKIFIDKINSDPLVQNISVSLFNVTSDIFEKASDENVRIEENGKLAVCDTTTDCIEIRGKNEYASGCHEIRLCIEKCSNSWTFLGINSKSTALQNSSYKSKSTYGWSNDNFIWSNGSDKFNNSNPHIQMKIKDEIRLMLDCNNHTISIVNNRTNAKHKLVVNVQHCPLPWQLHVILYESNSSVRILSYEDIFN